MADLHQVEIDGVVKKAALLAEVAAGMHQLDAVAQTFEQADAFGCFIDPTKWRDLHDDRRAIRALLEATRTFRSAAEKFLLSRDKILAARAGATS